MQTGNLSNVFPVDTCPSPRERFSRASYNRVGLISKERENEGKRTPDNECHSYKLNEWRGVISIAYSYSLLGAGPCLLHSFSAAVSPFCVQYLLRFLLAACVCVHPCRDTQPDLPYSTLVLPTC